MCVCLEDRAGEEGPWVGVVGKMLAEMPCGKAGKAVAIQMDDGGGSGATDT